MLYVSKVLHKHSAMECTHYLSDYSYISILEVGRTYKYTDTLKVLDGRDVPGGEILRKEFPSIYRSPLNMLYLFLHDEHITQQK